MSPIRLLSISIVLSMLSLQSFGQGCNGWMFPAYTTYYSSSNPNGNQITTSVTVEGTTNGSCPGGCNCGATHTPKANNVISATGGWQSGAASSWSSYLSKTNTQQIVAYPGVLYPFSWGGEIICSVAGILYQVGNSAPPVAGFTPSQHSYPNNPLSNTPCWISQAYDAVTKRGQKHSAQDIIKDGGGKGANIAVGTPVYAAESGTVTQTASTNVHASYPACATQNPAPQPNFVKVKGSDGYYTVYAHVTPTVTSGQVTAGQQIGITDASGCQSNPHIHMTRRDANGNFYNFHLPCGNAEPTSSFSDGLIDDNVDPI